MDLNIISTMEVENVVVAILPNQNLNQNQNERSSLKRKLSRNVITDSDNI